MSVSVKQQVLEELIEPVVQAFGLELWGLQYIAQNNHAVLRVFIDSASGVGVEDCAKVSRQLSTVLDVEDPISGKYTLEVSSPGLDRSLFKLQQYGAYIGQEVKLKLNHNVDFAEQKRKKFRAHLLAVDEVKNSIRIAVEGQEIEIDFLNIDKANVLGDVSW